MGLTGRQKRYLKGLAHHRKAAVTIGARGLSEAVLEEIRKALGHHELLKIKLPPVSRSERAQLMESICKATGSEVVQVVGRTGVVFAAAEPPRIVLPG